MANQEIQIKHNNACSKQKKNLTKNNYLGSFLLATPKQGSN